MILLYAYGNRIAWYWFYNSWEKSSIESRATMSALHFFISQKHKRFDNEQEMDAFARGMNESDAGIVKPIDNTSFDDPLDQAHYDLINS